jgi:hypothetical protein
MKYYERILWGILVISPLTFFYELSLLFPNNFGYCDKGDDVCGVLYAPYQETASLVSFISILLFYVSLILLVRKKAYPAYLAWRKFAIWYLSITASLLFILWIRSGGVGSGFNPGYGFDTESLVFFFSGLFAIISIILILYKSIKLRGK